MEQTETYRLKLASLSMAIVGFASAMRIDFSGKSDLEIDLLKNGQIQKFEYCIELVWKTIKAYLTENHGLDCFSPKSCIKAFFQSTVLSQVDYEKVMEMIDDRNKLSHIYQPSEFEAIHQKLPNYLAVLKNCQTILVKSD